MSDDDELRRSAVILEVSGHALDIGFVQSRIDFVDQAERCRMIGQKGQEQSDDRQGPFAAGKERQGLLFLSWRADIDFHAGFQDVFLVGQCQVGRAAAEEAAEDILEMDADFFEGLGELFGHGRVDFSDDSPQSFPRFLQIVALADVKVPFFQSRLVFVFGSRVDGP